MQCECISSHQPYTFRFCLCGQGLEEVSRTEFGKKIKEGMEEAAKTAKTSAENVSKSGEMLGKTGAFRAISQVQSHCFLLFNIYYLTKNNFTNVF